MSMSKCLTVKDDNAEVNIGNRGVPPLQLSPQLESDPSLLPLRRLIFSIGMILNPLQSKIGTIMFRISSISRWVPDWMYL